MFPAPTTNAISTPRLGDLVDLDRDPLDPVGIGAVVERAQKSLARELQEDALERRIGHWQTQA